VLVAAVAALVLPPAALAAGTSKQLMPDVNYVRDVRTVGGSRVVFHVVTGPQPGGLYDLRPTLSNGRVRGLETLSSMQRRLRPRANVVGVNGDYYNLYGSPSGIFVQRNVLKATPMPARSSLGIRTDGLLRIAPLGFAGSFQIGSAPVHRLKQFNRLLRSVPGFALYLRSWGDRTPTVPRAREAILEDVGVAFPNRDRAARVVRVARGSGHAIPAGGAVLQARGWFRKLLTKEAAPGALMTFRLGLESWWDNVEDAIGGGPRLVRGGVAVYRPQAEAFTSYQLDLRHPRTAVGQRPNGRVILLVADGRSSRSHGLTMNQLAKAMVHYGAERAMALDGGGSSEIAFNTNVLNRPSDGRERAISNSLQFLYIGAYARKPRHAVFSPNGDGYLDRQRLYAKFVRPSNVHLQLIRPNGELKWELRGARDPGVITKALRSQRLMEGRWRWVVAGTDTQGRASRMVRRFRVNNTLGFLDLSTRDMRVRPRRGGYLRIGFQAIHTADVRVFIARRGRTVRHLVSRDGLAPGAYAVIWNGKNGAGRVVRSGKFSAVVRAKNRLGSVGLRKAFRVERVS
jgi:hypothetical protein